MTKDQADTFQRAIKGSVVEECVRNRQGFGLRVSGRLLTQIEEAEAFVAEMQRPKGAVSK